MAEIDTTLIAQGMLRLARQQANPVTSSTYQGQSQGIERKFDAKELLALAEACLQRLEAETAAGGADKLPQPGAIRYGIFC